MKKGFTLVELAIVFVIIGLLTGGILVGQNMIRWTKLVSLQTQTTQFGMLVSQFKMTYGALPGEYLDANTAWPQIYGVYPGTVYCLTRNVIPGNPVSNMIDDPYKSEGAFAQLQASGMLKMGRPQILQDGTSPPYWTCYANNMQQNAAISTRINNLYGSWAYSGPGLWGYNGTMLNGLLFGSHFTPVATGAEALALDMKFDDGLPMTGKIKSTNTAAGNCNYDAGNTAVINTYNNRYLDISSKLTCYMQIFYPEYYNSN